MNLKSEILIIGFMSVFCAVSITEAQTPPPNPSFHVTMEPGTILAVNYQHRESTEIGFQGSPMLPLARGHAKVTGRTGRISIEAEFNKLRPAQTFGPEFLTYVLWAITPEGKANNLGEVLLDGDHSKIGVTTALQTFGLIVTAEPYYAVASPSDAVALVNVLLPQTTGTMEQINASYQMLGRGVYTYDVAAATARYPKSKTPLELDEARNAVEIARHAGAGQYAPDAFNKATTSLTNAEQYSASRGDRKLIIQAARDAVQNAADAEQITVRRIQEEADAAEKAAEARRTADAQAAAADATARQQQAELDRQRAELQKQQADAQAAQDAAARSQAEAARAEADAARQKALAQAQADQAAAAAAQQQAATAQAAAQEAERQREELRATLLEQFNRILPTTDTPRGLKANISDVLFATGKYELQPAAREALAKFSGIVIAHPGLKLSVEGYTDSTGSDEFNQTLSENRAGSVRAYLVGQGIDPNSVTATGFGKSNPVADNEAASGRRLNRRVEIIISGEIIGTHIGGSQPGDPTARPTQ
jgi:outer membrane protein OmpA-like peptidoglycan-associated protein